MLLEVVHCSFGPQGLNRDFSDQALRHCYAALVMSLVKALSLGVLKDVHLTLVTDGLTPQQCDLLQKLTQKCPFLTRVMSMSEGKDQFSLVSDDQRDQRDLFDMIFFVERDCLLAPDAIEQMIVDYKMMTAINNEDLLLSPYDNLELYRSPRSSLIVAGRTRYWRTVGHTSGTMMLSHRAFKKAGHLLKNLGEGFPLACLSPMPALAASANDSTSPPFVPLDTWLKESSVPFSEDCALSIPPGIV